MLSLKKVKNKIYNDYFKKYEHKYTAKWNVLNKKNKIFIVITIFNKIILLKIGPKKISLHAKVSFSVRSKK